MRNMRQRTFLLYLLVVICLNVMFTLFDASIKDLFYSQDIFVRRNNFIIHEVYDKTIQFGRTPGQNNNQKARRHKLKRNAEYPIVSFQSYKINNPNICSGLQKISTIVMVYSRPNNFQLRKLLRKRMLNSTHYYPESIRVVFLLGSVTNNYTQKKIEDENSMHHDIVQGFYIDSYRNLTNKGVMGFKWINEHCMNAYYVTKIDSDVFINFFKVFEKLNVLKLKKRLIYCNRIKKNRMAIVRNKRSKWYVNNDIMKGQKHYPLQYCSGCVVFLSIDLVPMLYHASLSVPFFWIDDYYLFGLLPSRIKGVTYLPLSLHFTWSVSKALKCYNDRGSNCNYAISYLHTVRSFDMLWDAVVKDRYQSVYGNFYMDLPERANLTKT